ncbi:DUF2793 domain-containing protein [Yoonia sediminilitoris]|uniref:Uncharacterized protein DUF2793 n=1 Tax=Yoonia sediminilitoris TaxID=1286148 RepID=A0A2T6KH99_9RHOB|nr:DUF2793 domain-containing protein [Yoonia sediminilitoris]PUB14841.1 uncharacterized protein DUF2793 [Yoonia sediminilitoris]RCW95558.1 uncharacterized protein DUF2793 [Yoonia sediminilitoris]
MPDQTPNLSLPFILPAQAQKHVTHNEAIELLDMIVQLTLENIDVTAPPVGATEGQAWGVGAAATGQWSGQDDRVATWRGGGWLFVTPRDGWLAWVRASNGLHVFTDGQWAAQYQNDLNNLAGVGVNTTADSTNRLSVASDATLLSHEGTGHQLKVNKATLADTASLVYQSGFSGRAEMGLAGSDDFSIKVSGDGTTFATALLIDAATAKVQIGDLLGVTPSATPPNAAAGDIYFDNTTNKLRCFDGTIWQDLF